MVILKLAYKAEV